MQTTNVIFFLQRGVASFVMFTSSSVPLRNSFHWNPAAENLTGTDIPALFGYIASNLFDMHMICVRINCFIMRYLLLLCLANEHIFDSGEWIPLASRASCRGRNCGFKVDMRYSIKNILLKVVIVVLSLCRNHTTVRNNKHGIEAGLTVSVVWIY